jgi:hypothetical protein
MKEKYSTDTMAHTCNPSYTRNGDRVDLSLRPTWAEDRQNRNSTNKPGIVVQGYNLILVVDIARGITVQDWLWTNIQYLI